jgi:hypothetical protein
MARKVTAMDGKPKISPTHTYVFDENDLEQFDELSLSCVVKAIDMPFMADDADLGSGDYADTASFNLADFEATHTDLEDFAATATDVELSVDELLEGSAPAAAADSESAENSGTFEILIAPEEFLGTGSDDD